MRYNIAMNFPLLFQFKLVSFAPQFSVTDKYGRDVCYVRQKLFRLREDITVYQDSSKSEQISSIKADRIIDFSASYHFEYPNGTRYGSVRRRGWRSIWSVHYEIWQEGRKIYDIREHNPFVKVMDALFNQIPILNFFTGYMFNPQYDVIDTNGNICYILKKKPSFTGRRFEMQELLPRNDDFLAVMSLLMMTLLERKRG